MDRRQRIVITGVQLPFWDLVNLLIQLALAAIPALVLLSVVFAVLGSMVLGVIAGLG